VLAAKVRLAFPTAVVADLVRRGAFALSDPSVEPVHIADFLSAHQGKFAIGMEPVEAYLARTKIAGTPAAPAPLVAQVKRLQRVYQLTQDDQAMAALLRHNLDSAYAITRHDAAGFARAFQDKLGGADAARAVHARATQIHGSVLNIAVSYLEARLAPALGGSSPVHAPFSSPSPNPVYPLIAYPTLESLFGSLDYGNCRECRSILSAAAYLVDLLNYLDKPSPTAGYQNPQEVLFRRRPDLPYLPLTCENTNTLLPYIDVVNETLEYFVVNNLSLANYQGHTTDGDLTSEALMANPQYVNDAAYVTLQDGAFFPPPLPFNRPLELLRLHLRKLGLRLSDVMAALRVDDAIDRPSPTGYGWRDILMEQIGLSRQEYLIFTDNSLSLQELYGYPKQSDNDAVIADLSSLQNFSRRTGVLYDDLVSIVKTRFVNPHAILIPRLERLKVPFATLQKLKSSQQTLGEANEVKAFVALLPAGLDPRQYNATDYEGIATKWVMDDKTYAQIMGIITIAAPSNSPDPSSGVALQIRYSDPDPDPTKTSLTATDFIRLIRFIRLWRKLGLSIAHTDQILTALYPADAPNPEDGFKKLLPRIGFLFQVMERLSLSADTDLASPLACWAPIGTAGDDSLYRKMFLSPTVQDLGPQIATIDGPVTLGDLFTTTINGIPIPPEGVTAQAGDNVTSLARAIVSAINGTMTDDPDTGLPLNRRVVATSQGGVITIKAGFTLDCTPAESYTPASQTPLSRTATVRGPVTPGDVLITTINGLPISYTVASGDAPSAIATKIALAINDTATPDRFSGLPLNTLVVASSQAEVVAIDAVNAGAPFRLKCSLATGTYTAEVQTATLAGKFAQGTVLTTTIDGVAILYTVASGDNETIIANDIAAAINATTAPDRRQANEPLNKVVSASAQSGVITITPSSSSIIFTLTCSSSRAVYLENDASPESWTATITFGSGTGVGSATLTTTINGVTISTVDGSTDRSAGSFADQIVTEINNSSLQDPGSGQPLNSLIQASVENDSGRTAVIRISARDAAFLFTVQCSSSGSDGGGGEGAPQPRQIYYDEHGPFEPARTATVAGTITPGSIFTTTINGIAIPYAAVAGDTAVMVASNIAKGINGKPPLNQVISASADGGVITVTSRGALAFTMACSLSLAFATYTAGRRPSPFADDGYGNFLQDKSQTLFGHEPTLRAAFNLTGAEFTQIANALGYARISLLTLDNISAIFRMGWLAHTLRLSVVEFLTLRQVTGLDPFATLDPGATPPAEPPVIRFVRLLQALAAAGIQPVQALYLMWNQDISGKAAPAITEVTGLARTLRADFATVDAQFTLKDDPDGSIARGLMALVYGNSTTDFFFGLLNGTLTTSIPYPNPAYPSPQPSPQAMIDASNGRLSYDELRKQLTFAGFLDPVTQESIDLSIGNAEALRRALADLATANQRTVGPFFADYPELLPLYTVYASSGDSPQQKRTALLASFLPGLKQKRKQEQALATITAAVGTDASFATALLQDAAVLHAAAERASAAVTDLTAIEAQGLSARFFLTNNPAAAPDQTHDSVPSLSYAPNINPLPAGQGGGPIAAAWSGYVDAPQDGFYDIYIETDAGAAVSLQIGGTQVSMAQANNTWSNQSAISFQAGTLTPIVLTATSVKNTLSVTWAGFGLGRKTIPGEALYSATLVDNLNATYVRFLNTASLATGLSLTANEVAYLGAATDFRVNTTDRRDNVHAGDVTFTPASMSNIAVGSKLVIDIGTAQEVVTVTGITAATFSTLTLKPHNGTAIPFPIVGQAFPDIGRGWFNFLSMSNADDSGVGASLRDVLATLLDFVRIKQAVSPRDERLLAVLRNPTLSDGTPAVRTLTGWTLESLRALLQRLFVKIEPAVLSSIENLSRVYDAFVIAKTYRVTASALIAATTNAPSPASIGALQATLRAQYAERDWAALVRPINDAMRVQQRDALVAYILQRFGDVYEKSLIRSVTREDVREGTTVLALNNAADISKITRGMRIQGPNIAVYTTVLGVNDVDKTVVITPGTQARVPQGSNLTFVPADAARIDTADKLFEYFLIDVKTQPPVETSRIRLALSSVQLFIERVLRNLEPLCAPGDIEDPNASPRWPWMKRYRLWQANREVFLWPENWLYPELRDDQSPFFDEIMSSLLQSDITDDAAATAYLDYLTKLERVAKLEPCGLYYTPGSGDKNEASYVVARTPGAHRKHYFCQLKDGSWTPWTELKIDCEDMPITPIVWNGRLLLFWLKVLKQVSPPTINPSTVVGPGKTSDLSIGQMSLDNLYNFARGGAPGQTQGSMTFQAALCWSEFYNGKWQPAKTSDIMRPTTLGTFDLTTFDADRDLWRIIPVQLPDLSGAVTPFTLPNYALALAIRTGKADPYSPGFILYNTHSLPLRCDDIEIMMSDRNQYRLLYLALVPYPSRVLDPRGPYTGNTGNSRGTFSVTYQTDSQNSAGDNVLTLTRVPRYVEPQPGLPDAWEAPFFFEDRLYLFYVKPKVTRSAMPMHSGFGILSATPGLQRLAPNIPPLRRQQPGRAQTGGPFQARIFLGGFEPTAPQTHNGGPPA
jgi:hypothetical protein